MATEEQNVHMQNLVNQAKDLSAELTKLQARLAAKRDVFLKVQGAIEYLQQVGVEVPANAENDDDAETTEESDK